MSVFLVQHNYDGEKELSLSQLDAEIIDQRIHKRNSKFLDIERRVDLFVQKASSEGLCPRGVKLLQIFNTLQNYSERKRKYKAKCLKGKMTFLANFPKKSVLFAELKSTLNELENSENIQNLSCVILEHELNAKDVLRKCKLNRMDDVDTDDFFHIWNIVNKKGSIPQNLLSKPSGYTKKNLKNLEHEIYRRIRILRKEAIGNFHFVPSDKLLLELSEMCGEKILLIDRLSCDQKRKATIVFTKAIGLNNALTHVSIMIDSLENADFPGRVVSLQAMIDSKLSQIRKSFKILERDRPSVDLYPGKFTFDQLKIDIDELQQRFNDIVPEEPIEPHPDDILLP
ncbi:MAG: hypothetical protein WDZ27_06490 [Waddliaceae bacterium]